MAQGTEGSRPTAIQEDVAPTDAVREALAEAEALAEESRYLDAIERLSDANRRERNAEIEARLVYLRTAAFAELDRSPTGSPWPDEGPRERDGDEALPATDPSGLTPELVRDQILRYGCAYVPGLIPRAEAERLADGIDRAFDGHDRRFPERPEDADRDTAPWFVPFDPPDGDDELDETRKWLRVGGGVLTPESPRMMFDLLSALEDVGLDSVVAGYLGERPAVTLIKSALKRLPVIPGADWHQDVAVLGEGIRTINLWLSLSHCGDDAPGLDLIPRRLNDTVETGTGDAGFEWSVGSEMVERVADGVEVVRPIFEPGDALLFDELFLHRTATDTSMTKDRYAIETWFFAPSRFPSGHVPFVW